MCAQANKIGQRGNNIQRTQNDKTFEFVFKQFNYLGWAIYKRMRDQF